LPTIKNDQKKKLTFYGVNEDDESLPRAVMAGRKTVTLVEIIAA